MKILKDNQAIIYIIALMLITAGYLNYTTDNKDQVQQTSASTNTSNTINAVDEVADIGDAALVNSNDVVSESAPAEVETITEETSNDDSAEQEETPEVQQTSNTNDYFENSKIERDKMYSQMVEVYQNVLNSSSSQEKQKQVATEEIQKINNTKNSIMICENLIKTKGFDDSIVFVNGDSVNVIVGTNDLEKEEVSQIQSIIEREMNAKAENIHIAIK